MIAIREQWEFTEEETIYWIAHFHPISRDTQVKKKITIAYHYIF